MGMKESEYIKVENLTILRSILSLSDNLMGGDEQTVSQEEVSALRKNVYALVTKCFEGVKIDG
jgi:hypothetical protein